MKRFLIIVICVMLVAFSLAAVLWAVGGHQLHFGDWNNVNFNFGPGLKYTSEIDQSGECVIDGASAVRIETVAAPIHIYAADGDTLSATLTGSFSTNREELTPQLIVERSGGTAVVEIRYPQLSNISMNANMDLTVYLPASYAGGLELTTVSAFAESFMPLTLSQFSFDSVSGSIDISDVTAGEVELSTTSGKVAIEVAGCDTFAFESVSGALTAHTDASGVRVSTTSGRIDLTGLTGSLKASSISGGITAVFSELGDVQVDNTSGGVTLTIPQSSGFSLDYGTASGGFDCDFPITLTESGRMRTRGTVGEGGPAVRVQTVSGGLTIR